MSDSTQKRLPDLSEFTDEEILHALHESVKLQAHYAELLNMHDGGRRLIFKDARAWLLRLRQQAARTDPRQQKLGID